MNFVKIYDRAKVTFDRLLLGGTLRAKADAGRGVAGRRKHR